MNQNNDKEKLDERIRNGNNIFIEDKIQFLSQLKIRSKILKVLRENFDVSEKLVIKEKKVQENV